MRAYQLYEAPRASDYDTWMCVGTRGRFPTIRPSAATANTQRAMTRRFCHIGYKGAREIRLTHTGRYLDALVSGSGMQLPVGNDRMVEASIIIPGAPIPQVRVLYGGTAVGRIINGVWRYCSDGLPASAWGLSGIPGNTQVEVRLQEQVQVGEFHIRAGPLMSMPGESSKQSNGAEASQVMNTGDLVTPPSGTSINAGWAPVSIEGLPLTSHGSSWTVLGDSLSDGFNGQGRSGGSDGSDGQGGVYIDAFNDVNGRKIPYIIVAQSGSTVRVSMDHLDARMEFARTTTDGAIGWGTNDYGITATPGGTAAEIFARKLVVYRKLKAEIPGFRIHAQCIFPRTTSNNANQFLTKAEQTPRVAGFGPGGEFREPMNALELAAVASGEIDGFLDFNSALADDWAWLTDGVTVKKACDDGTHYSNGGGALGAVYFKGYLQSQLDHLPYR